MMPWNSELTLHNAAEEMPEFQLANANLDFYDHGKKLTHMFFKIFLFFLRKLAVL
jgi:hypothetical protein